MEVFQAGGECVGEKLPLEGTLGFKLLRTIFMHTYITPYRKGNTPRSLFKKVFRLQLVIIRHYKEKGKKSLELFPK